MGKRSERRSRRDIEERKPKGSVNQPETKGEQDKPHQNKDSLAVAGVSLGDTPTPARGSQKDDSSGGRRYRQQLMRMIHATRFGITYIVRLVAWIIRKSFGFLDAHHGSVTALATLAIVALTAFYVAYSRRQWIAMGDANHLTQTNISVSQRSFVTIGRKDGVVGEIILPQDNTSDAEMVMYFQNSGHIPAEFSWGTMLGFLAFPSGQTNSSGITFTHPYKGGMYRNRNRKDGTIAQRAGDTIIAGESIYAASFGTISRKALADFQKSGKELLITGIYKYCDGLGNFSSRSFDMVYDHATPGAALSFKLQGDTLVPYNGESTIDTEMLSPCETFAERQQDQEAQRNRPFAKPAKPSKTVEKTAKVR